LEREGFRGRKMAFFEELNLFYKVPMNLKYLLMLCSCEELSNEYF
jgi:hypothetical protein